METNMDDKTVKADLMVVQLDRARTALAEAKTIGETKKIMDMAHAAHIYARRQQLGEEAMAYAHSIKYEAYRKLGEILQAAPKNIGSKGSVVPNWDRAHLDATPTLDELGLTNKESALAQQLAALEPDRFAIVVENRGKLHKVLKLQRLERKLEREKDGKEERTKGKNKFQARLGEVWALGAHRLMCGNSYEKKDVKQLLAGCKPDALITDPPYGIAYKPDWVPRDGGSATHHAIIGDDKPFDPRQFMEYKTVALFGANYFSDKLPLGSWICWDKRDNDLTDDVFCAPFELAWYKSQHTTKRAMMIRCKHGGFVNADKGEKSARLHPTQKPIIVMEEILQALTRSGETVLDLFAGVGSTLLACANTKRTCYAMEIEREYVGVILNRWHEKTGIAPELVD
jgi:DNA modification methylase